METPVELVHLCFCCNCNTLMLDKNPQTNAPLFPTEDRFVEMQYMTDEYGGFWGCPICNTDAYLMDAELDHLASEPVSKDDEYVTVVTPPDMYWSTLAKELLAIVKELRQIPENEEYHERYALTPEGIKLYKAIKDRL